MCRNTWDNKPHERGAKPGSCHDCAVCYDENYNLIPEGSEDDKA